MPTGRVTAADVARAAGVSATTVSFVLNDTPGQSIPAATRTRVRDAADALGYAPSAAARALARGRSGVVLCLLRDMPVGSALAELLSQIARALEAHDLTAVWHPRSADSRPLSHVWRDVTPAAVLSFDELSAEEERALRATGAAVVTTQPEPGTSGSLPSDHHHGRAQAEYLIAQGCRRLGYASPADPRVADVGRLRRDGVAEACHVRGLPAPVEAEVDDTDPGSATPALHAWADAGVDGVCAYNDETAMAVLAAAATAGVPVPRLIGMDDTPAAALTIPPLTTVRRDWVTTGNHLTACIVAELAGEPRPTPPAVYHCEVVQRATA